MKENKFLFYGCVIATIACAAWLRFRVPVDIEFIYEPEIMTMESEMMETTETMDSEDFFIDVQSDENIADKETDNKENVANGDFTGCSARFKSKIWARDLDDGQSVERYQATNEITCQCQIAGGIVERKVVYEYSSEPGAIETDCNKKCAEICAE